MESVPERVARNEAIFREVNERIAALAEQSEEEVELELVCECGDASCTARVSVSAREYEAVRQHPRRFIVAPGHVRHPESERDVARGASYKVVEKLAEAGNIASETDPRGGGK